MLVTFEPCQLFMNKYKLLLIFRDLCSVRSRIWRRMIIHFYISCYSENSSSSVQMKLEESLANMVLEPTISPGFVEPTTPNSFSGDVGVPMQGVQYTTENGSITGKL